MIYIKKLEVKTPGRGTIELTGDVIDLVLQSGISVGLCHLFVHHTSASLLISENADSSVRRDLERFMSRMAPDGHVDYEHDAEGPDDMPAHIRSVLTGSELTVPVSGGRPALGTWQGVYLWEHRRRPHRRTITVTVMGEA